MALRFLNGACDSIFFPAMELVSVFNFLGARAFFFCFFAGRLFVGRHVLIRGVGSKSFAGKRGLTTDSTKVSAV